MCAWAKPARSVLIRWTLPAFLLVLTACIPAETPGHGPRTVPQITFAGQISSAQAIASACGTSATACDGTHLPDREVVTGAPGGAFQVSWSWFADALTTARTASVADRALSMEAARAHLKELSVEASSDGAPPAEFIKAHAAARAVLARPEFRAVEQPGWLERHLAVIQDWILRLFTGMDRLGRRAPWLAPLIEWGCFALAAAGLLWFVRQSLARQALRLSLADSAALAPQADRGSADWARMAEERAEAAAWREAVHCLYWAAIALMENRRAWKPSETRTPREYIRLLQPGSEAHRALRALTYTFETIWYGRAEADAADYRHALASFRSLEAARPTGSTVTTLGSTSSPPSSPALGGA